MAEERFWESSVFWALTVIVTVGLLVFWLATAALAGPTLKQVLKNYTSIGVREITAYHAVTRETDSTPDWGAGGRVAINGVPTGKWCAAPRSIPFGTKIIIPAISGDTVWTVRDRLARKYDHRIDLLIGLGSAGIGLRKAEVFVLEN